MPQLEIAHLNEQGVDMIIVPLGGSFGSSSTEEQQATISELQMRSRAAGLRGRVVPVWDSGFGRMAFVAPRPWHPFLESIGLDYVARNLNRVLSW